jgi:hypothetical protein
MTDLPTPERRAELRAVAITYSLFADLGIVKAAELDWFLAATEPVKDGAVARVVERLQRLCATEYVQTSFIVNDDRREWVDATVQAAALLERLVRERDEAKAALAVHRLPPTTTASALGRAGNLKYEDGWPPCVASNYSAAMGNVEYASWANTERLDRAQQKENTNG